MRLNQPKWIIACVLFLSIFVQLMISLGQWLNVKESLVIFTSSAITGCGWYFSAYLNHRSFERSEFIKNKDKITSLVEKFFDDLDQLIKNRETTEKDIEDFVSNKTAELTLKATQLKRVFGSKTCFLNTDTITVLQNKPIDLLNSDFKIQKEELKKLRVSTLEEIDQLYDGWLTSL